MGLGPVVPGFSDRAAARFDEAIALAEKLGHVYSLAFALTFAAGMRNDRRDFAAALECAKQRPHCRQARLAAVDERERYSVKGFAAASLGRHAEGIEQLRSGISGLQRMGDFHHRESLVGLLAAAAYLDAGADSDAQMVLTRRWRLSR
jgi:hypothetical protein